MMQIYLLECVSKKLYINIIFRSYKFPKKKIAKKNISKKENKLVVGDRALESLLARAR